MNIKEYAKQAVVTESTDFKAIRERLKEVEMIRLLHGILGMVTEIGEFADQVKRHLFYGTPIDWVNLNEELGDQMWYIALLSDVCDKTMGTDLTDTCKANIEKLRKRFPEKFKNFDAMNRDLAAERKVLEEHSGNNDA